MRWDQMKWFHFAKASSFVRHCFLVVFARSYKQTRSLACLHARTHARSLVKDKEVINQIRGKICFALATREKSLLIISLSFSRHDVVYLYDLSWDKCLTNLSICHACSSLLCYDARQLCWNLSLLNYDYCVKKNSPSWFANGNSETFHPKKGRPQDLHHHHINASSIPQARKQNSNTISRGPGWVRAMPSECWLILHKHSARLDGIRLGARYLQQPSKSLSESERDEKSTEEFTF